MRRKMLDFARDGSGIETHWLNSTKDVCGVVQRIVQVEGHVLDFTAQREFVVEKMLFKHSRSGYSTIISPCFQNWYMVI